MLSCSKGFNLFLLTIILIFMLLGQGERVGLLYFHEILLILLATFNIGPIIASFNHKLFKFGWLFIFIALVSFIINLPDKSRPDVFFGFAYLLRWVLYYAIPVIVVRLSSGCHRVLATLLLTYIVGFCLVGYAAYIVYPDMRILSYLGYDDHYYRFVGSLLDPNFTGIVIVLGLLYISYLFRYQKFQPKWLLVLLFTILLGGLVLTFSRASYLSLLIGMTIFLSTKKRLRYLVAFTIVFSLIVILVPKPSGEGGRLLRKVSIEARLRSYQRALEVVKTNPIIGIGYNNYRFEQIRRGYISGNETIHSASGADNSFLLILATTGILGLVIFINQQYYVWKAGSILVRASLGSIIVHSFFNNSFFFPWVIIWLWLIVGHDSTTREYYAKHQNR